MTDPATKLVGQVVLGRYRILTPLARGGMGVVYLARSEGAAGFRRPVVVKRVVPEHADDPRAARMFVREARIMSTLRHAGIVGVIDFGEDGDAYVMVLEYVHGYDLSTWARFTQATAGPLPVDLVLHVVICVLDALAYAHALTGPDGRPQKLVHRDVTPSNVLVDTAGQVRLADFGIARSEVDATDVRTEGGGVKGKLPYIAPEIFAGSAYTQPTDVYSVGVMLHELLVGRNELKAGDPSATIARVSSHELTPVNAVRPEATEALAQVVRRATAKDPARRFDSAVELATELRALRAASSDRAQEALAARASRDFRDSRIHSFLRVPTLEARQRDWQSTQSGDDSGELEELASGSMTVEPSPRDAEGRRSSPRVEPTPRRARSSRGRRAPWLVAGLAVAGAVALGAWVLVRETTSTVVVVRRTEEGRDEDRRDEVDPAVTALRAALTEKQEAVNACFEHHLGRDAHRRTDVEVRVTVRADGHVSRAEVRPVEVSSPALEACVQETLADVTLLRRGRPYVLHIPSEPEVHQ